MKHDPDTTKRLAREEFEAWAHRYDESILNHFLFQPSHAAILEELARWQSQTERSLDLLDIGCGTGTLVSKVEHSNLDCGHIVGLDYAMEMCQQAQAKAADNGSRRRFNNADSEFLPYASGTFDIVSCANSFHHYPHQQSVVREFRRVLRPGGRLIIVDGFRDNVIGWAVFDVIIATIEKSVHHAPWATMRSYFHEAGFLDICQRKFSFLFPALLTVGSV